MANEVLMVNPNSNPPYAQQFLSAGNINDIGKLKSAGWVENPKLIDMYHPGYKKHVMVPVQETKTWENKGYFAEPTMVYHPKGPKTEMVSAAEAKKMVQNGWYLSPAHFPGVGSDGVNRTSNVMKEAS